MGQASNIRIYEQCIHRHWCSQSEKFTGADSLITAQHRGWEIIGYRIDKVQGQVSQGVLIYTFTLQFQDECMVMSVIANPYVERIVRQLCQMDRVMDYPAHIGSDDRTYG